jgi:hypothetical protein
MVDHVGRWRKFQGSQKGGSASNEKFWEKKQGDHGGIAYDGNLNNLRTEDKSGSKRLLLTLLSRPLYYPSG